MGIRVKVGTTELSFVREVARSRSMNRNAFIQPDGEGALFRSWTISGYIKGSPEALIVEQTALEDALAGEGDCTIEIQNHVGTTLVTFQGRVTEVNWAPYHTGPLAFYEIAVETESQANPFAGTIILNSITLDDPVPALVETYRIVNEDDPMDKIHSRTFRLTGRKRSDPAGVETFLASLENAITTGASDGYFTFTTPMGTFNARAVNFEVVRPEETDAQSPVTYTIEIETIPDYSLESFNLPHQQVSVAGITWDVVASFNHSITRRQIGTTSSFRIADESMSWSLKKWFTNFGDIEGFKTTLDNIVNNRVTMFSPVGTLMEAKSIAYNVPTIDGHDPLSDVKRYAVTATLTFGKPTGQRDNPGGSVFGVTFAEITSDSRGVSIDEYGGISSRNRNVSGKVITLPPDSLLGSSVQEADGTYYITGYNKGRIDDDGRWEISLSGRTLETDTQCGQFVDEVFAGVHFNAVRSRSKSVSRSRQLETDVLEVTSISESVSGDLWGVDAEPLLSLVSVANSFYGASEITNMSIGDKQPLTHPTTKDCTFKQSVSLTRVTTYKPTEEADEEEETEEEEPPRFDPGQPDEKEEESWSIDEQTNRYASITIPGGNIVFKKIGINPEKARARRSKTAANHTIFKAMSAPGAPSQPPGFAGGPVTRNVEGEQGLTKFVEKEWTADRAV